MPVHRPAHAARPLRHLVTAEIDNGDIVVLDITGWYSLMELKLSYNFPSKSAHFCSQKSGDAIMTIDSDETRQPNQDSAPISTDLDDPGEEDIERAYKCRTFFKSVATVGALKYFEVDSAYPCMHVQWMWAPLKSQQLSELERAFRDVRPIRLWFGMPSHISHLGYAARVYRTHIEHVP